MGPNLDNILDNVVDDVLKDHPYKSEFEAGFMALRLNLTVLAQTLMQVGMMGNGLTNEALFGVCTGLTETCLWMAAKEMAADTMRDIDKG